MEPSSAPDTSSADVIESGLRPGLLSVFVVFLRIGATAFGGIAMIPQIEAHIVHRRKWVMHEAFQAGVALAQLIPGATVMQVAGYAGGQIGGPIYAGAAFVGFALPAFVLMLALSAAYQSLSGVPLGAAVFQGFEASVTAIVAHAAFTYGKRAVTNAKQYALGAIAIVAFMADLSPALIVLFAGAAGTWLFQSPPGQGSLPWSVQRRDFHAPIILALTGAAILLSLNWLDPKLGSLAAVMAKIDLFAFGGAFGSLPLMLHEVVEVRHWLEPGPFLDGIALGQVTPGPVMVTAAFVGWHLANFTGALVATVGIFFPSFVVLLACRPIAERLRRHRLAGPAMKGISASVAGMIVATGIKFVLLIKWTPFLIGLAICATAGLSAGLGPLWVVIAGALLSGAVL
jgi:chromate transporter